MKKILIFIIIYFLTVISIFAQNQNPSNKSRNKTDEYKTYLCGFSGTYPILSEKKIKKLNNQEKKLLDKIEILELEKSQILEELITIGASDTTSVRKHMSFIGGLWTIPKLTPEEKKISKEKDRLAKIELKKSQLLDKLTLIENLRMRNESHVEKRILWGFARWEVKKKSIRNESNTASQETNNS